jgi:hypothetical protein
MTAQLAGNSQHRNTLAENFQGEGFPIYFFLFVVYLKMLFSNSDYKESYEKMTGE